MERSNLKPFIRKNLDILYIGLNPALGSSRNRHYFSVNQAFWNQLYESGLIREQVDKSDADTKIFGSPKYNFNNWNYGITDLVDSVAESRSAKIKPNSSDCQKLVDLIKENCPLVAILLHSTASKSLMTFLGKPAQKSNSGFIGKLIEHCDTAFFDIAFPHGNTITSSEKIKRYIEVKDYLLKLKGHQSTSKVDTEVITTYGTPQKTESAQSAKEIIRTRTLRPSTRKDSSPYKIDTEGVGISDILTIEISEEDNPTVLFKFQISGKQLQGRKSLHFNASKMNSKWVITWSGLKPILIQRFD